MADPYFKLSQEVHVVRNHCASCSEVESRMQHPIKVRAVMAYGEEFTYRIEHAKGACFNVNEACLCTSSSGHSYGPVYSAARPSRNRSHSCTCRVTNRVFSCRIDYPLCGRKCSCQALRAASSVCDTTLSGIPTRRDSWKAATTSSSFSVNPEHGI